MQGVNGAVPGSLDSHPDFGRSNIVVRPIRQERSKDWAPPAWILNLIYPSLGWAAGGPAGYPSPPGGSSVFNGLRTQTAVSRLVGDT